MYSKYTIYVNKKARTAKMLQYSKLAMDNAVPIKEKGKNVPVEVLEYGVPCTMLEDRVPYVHGSMAPNSPSH
jgi:hypothetical protein